MWNADWSQARIKLTPDEENNTSDRAGGNSQLSEASAENQVIPEDFPSKRSGQVQQGQQETGKKGSCKAAKLFLLEKAQKGLT